MIIFPSAHQVFFKAVCPGASHSGARFDFAYVEFSNGDAVPPADVAVQTLRSHFDSLKSTADRDYLRIPILSHSLEPSKEGKPQLTLLIATDGTHGVHGKPFSSTSGSRVYAVTIVASQMNDREDIFAARHHYAVAEQLSKPESGSITLSVTLI
jgi:hypothetical protein